MSSNYKFVNVRFNLNDEDESKIYAKLNQKNRGGHVKKELKKTLLEEAFEKAKIESVVRDMVIQMDTKEDKKIKEDVSLFKSGIKIVVNGKDKYL